jgi:hypothetical protein
MVLRYFSPSRLRSTRPSRRKLGCGIIAFLAVAVAAGLVWHRHCLYQEFIAEANGFRDLGELAVAMVNERAKGVSSGSDVAFISSFDAFYEYVAARRPDLVGARSANNPFPGALPGEDYGRLERGAAGETDLLLWSRTTHSRPIGDVQLRLTCAGEVLYRRKGTTQGLDGTHRPATD